MTVEAPTDNFTTLLIDTRRGGGGAFTATQCTHILALMPEYDDIKSDRYTTAASSNRCRINFVVTIPRDFIPLPRDYRNFHSRSRCYRGISRNFGPDPAGILRESRRILPLLLPCNTLVRGHSRSLKVILLESLGTVSYSTSIVTMAVSLTISEIFSVKEWPDLEITVWGCSRSLKMARFYRPYTTYYWSAIVNVALIWYRFWVIWR